MQASCLRTTSKHLGKHKGTDGLAQFSNVCTIVAHRISPAGRASATVAASKSSSLNNSILSVVRDEQKYAAESYRRDPELLEGPPNDFDLESTPGTRTVYLLKQYKDEQIVIDMDVMEEPDDDDALDLDEGQDEGEQEDMIIPVSFRVRVQSPGKGMLVIQCSSDGEFLTIKKIALIAPDDDENDEDEEEDDAYTGPAFEDLDDTLQQAFLDYLEERGVDAEMGNYLQLLHADKSAIEYQGWLSKLNAFFSP